MLMNDAGSPRKTIKSFFAFIAIVASAIGCGPSILGADDTTPAENIHGRENSYGANERPLVEFHGPNLRPGYPDTFSLDYILEKDTLSPNGKFGFIYPDAVIYETDESLARNFIVALDPPQILALLDVKSPEHENKSHGGHSIEWSSDSSVALLTLESKWGPGDFILVELQNGRVKRLTQLGAKIRQLFKPDYERTGHHNLDDITLEYQESEAEFCKLEGSTLVRIDAYATSDPKGFDSDIWRARLRATWDIGKGKFTQQKVTRSSSGKRDK
jgi:hypothetical protein